MPRPHPLALTAAAAAAAALTAATALAFARRARRLRAASLAFTEAHELCALLRTGQLRSLELLDLLLARAARLDPRLNALVVRDFRRARARAAAADAALAEGRLLGVLHGLPVTIKEELAVAGLECTQGRPECAREPRRASCEAVARLEAAGAIVFAKTNVPLGCLDWQAYNPLYGATANPWDARRTPGGSSGGSAAAVAAGLSPLDVGGDVAGSIRLPASFCGVVGLAPSHERVPCRGAHSMVVYGPIARSAADCALALAVLEAPAPLPHQRRMTLVGATAAARLAISAVVGGVEWRSVRVARWQEHAGAPKVDADVAFALEEVARRLRAAGALVDDAARPALTDEQLCAAGPGAGVGCAVAYQALLAHCDGTVRPAEEFLEAQEEIKQAWDQFFVQGYDAVVAPVTVSAAFVSDLQPPPANAFTPLDRTLKLDSGEERPYGDHYFWPHLAIIAGLPAVSVPTGKTRVTKLPIGVQLIGPRGSDVRLLQLSHALMALCQTATAEVPPGFGA